MNLLRLLRSESRTSPRRLLWIATLSGLANALILAVINSKAKPDIIPLGHLDAMLKVAERLDRGGFGEDHVRGGDEDLGPRG